MSYDLPDVPVAMRRSTGYETRGNARLRNALAARDALQTRSAVQDWISKDVRLQVPVLNPEPGKPKTRWIGWLAWAAWVDSHHLNGPEYPDNTRSSGIVEALLDAGMFDWNAMQEFPNRRWAQHAGFQALQKACMDRLATLPRKHRIYLQAHHSPTAPYPPVHRDDRWGHGDHEPTWLGLAVQAQRLDVVERWVKLGTPVMHQGNTYDSPWQQAWRLALYHGAKPPQDPAQATPDLRIAQAIEAGVLAAQNVGYHTWRPIVEDVRDEVLSLIGLGVESLTKPHLDHAPTRDAMVQALHRTVAHWPVDLQVREHADELRLGSGQNKDLHPFAQATLNALERHTLERTLREDPLAGATGAAPVTASPARRRL